MDLRKLVDKIISSAQEDWHLIADAPTYHDRHHSVGVYIPDVSITVASRLKWNDDFKEDWCKNYPDPHASGCYLDVFFNNALVFRAAYVWVDGVNLPLPQQNAGKLEVTKRACDLMKVFDRQGRSPRPDYNPYESDVSRAGFEVVEHEWPKFPRKPSGLEEYYSKQ